MPNLWVARRAKRVALYLPQAGTHQNPGLLFLLPKSERGEIDNLVRGELAKQGISKESEVQAIVDSAEKDYEQRVKVAEIQKEVRRLMEIRAKGGKLMQCGFRKWRQVYFPAIKRFEKNESKVIGAWNMPNKIGKQVFYPGIKGR